MAITLGNLRTFCAEIASPDSAGATFDREAMRWLNAAIQRVFSDCAWDRILHQQKITVLPVEEKTTFGVTEGSRAITLQAPDSFLPAASTKYLDERWELHLDGEGQETFELSAIASATAATLRAGDEWTSDTDASVEGAFVKTIYTLPNSAASVERVQVLETGVEVLILQPHEFDYQRSFSPTQRGGYPRFCTFRKGAIEIWPHPGDTYCKLGLTYRKGPVVLDDDDVDATEIDWPEEQRDLLEKAILVEAAVTQGEDAPVPYGVAVSEYVTRLNTYKALNANKDHQTGPLGVNMPIVPAPFGSPAWNWAGPLEDV